MGERESLEVITRAALKVLKNNLVQFNGHRMVVPHLIRYPVPYCWDTAFHVLGLLHVNPSLARENIDGLLSLARDDGLIPNAPLEQGDQDLRSQPPVIVFAAYEYYKSTKDLDSLSRWYPVLKKYYFWWRRNGSPQEAFKGMISPFTGTRNVESPMLAFWAVCSTGMDNHAVYDITNGSVLSIQDYYYVPVLDVFLSSIMAATSKHLSIIARELSLKDEAQFFEGEFRDMKERINEYMWDDKEGFYYSLLLDGKKIEVKSIQAFTTLFAEIPEKSMADRLLDYLEDEREFNGEYGIPTISFSDEKYMSPQPEWMFSRDPYYWRGPIWAPTTYLVFRGLRNYGFVKKAEKIVYKWILLIKKAGGFYEYYYNDGRPGATNLSNFGWTAAVTIKLLVDGGLMSEKDINELHSEVEQV